jgi:TolA-binding protein
VNVHDLPQATPTAAPHGIRATQASPVTPAPTSTALGPQVAAIDGARRAFAAGDATRALQLVGDYEARYPAGAFTQEAEVLRVEALLRQGDRVGARSAGTRFLAQYPSSPHAARMRALIDPSP